MRYMKKIFKICLKDDAYTYIETFLLLLILGVISGVIYTNTRSISIFTTKSQNELMVKNDLLNMKLLLHEEIQKIQHPWFLKEYEFIEDTGSLEMFYYKGLKDQSLLIEFGENGLRISGNGEDLFLSPNLKGTFSFSYGFILYKEEEIILTFPLGVILV